MPSSGFASRALLLTAVLALALAALLFILLWTAGDPASAQDDTSTERPAKPTGLSVETERGSLTASMDWNDVAGADEYRVQWRLHGPGQSLNAGVRPTSSETRITVADYGRWVVRVQACNSEGCSGPVAQHFTTVPAPLRRLPRLLPQHRHPLPLPHRHRHQKQLRHLRRLRSRPLSRSRRSPRGCR